jgi:alginate O-acetyltransferase complex protein AlgI
MDLFSGIFIFSENDPMLFTRIYFWGFLTILLLFYSLVYKRNSLRNGYLLLMSLFFYYKSGGFFFILLIISISCQILF